MKSYFFIGAFVIAFGLTGCDSKAPAGSQSNPKTIASATAPATNGQGSTSQTDPTKASANSPTPSKTFSWVSGKDLPLSQVPADLQSLPCYTLYGFDAKPQQLVMTISGKDKFTGEQSVHLKKVTADTADFVIERTGDLVNRLGDDYIELRKDGVYAVGNSLASLNSPALQVPASLPVGAKWSSNTSTTILGSNVEQKLSFTVKSQSPIQLPSGTAQATVISGSGTESNGSQVSHLTIEIYCVPGQGQVKQTIGDQTKGQAKRTVVMQLKGMKG